MLSSLLLVLHPIIGASQTTLPPILPKPVSMHAEFGGPFEITRDTVLIDPENTEATRIFQAMLIKGSGFQLHKGKQGSSAGAIRFEKAPTGSLHAEGYSLKSGSDGITVLYADSAGALYAVETLRQLLPPAIEGPKASQDAHWSVPAVTIEDYPRFPWRGMHLDVSRHFFPAPYIKKYLDYLTFMKMNVFHWHLVDDGGWRIQLDKYPKLTSMGAWRYGITSGWDQSKLRFDPASKLPKYGGYYTKKEIRDVVKYAAERNITVVPEIEMPGHTMPVFAAYPDLECQNQKPAAQPGQPASNVYCVGNEKTFDFVHNVLDEVMELFPSPWIHIGGDEVDKSYWKACPLCQAKIKAEGLKNEEELQSFFIRHIDHYLASKGRRLIGWDEILEGGLAKGATVMSWRGIDGGIAAAKAGHDVVMSPTSHSYFDYSNASLTTEHVYTFDPVPPALNEEEAKHVLGGQANVWTEWIPTTSRVEFMIFPRITAMSETLWSPKAGRNYEEFMTRMPSIFERLDRLGASYYMPAPRVETNALLFKDSAKIAAVQERWSPGTLRYSLDGKAPTAQSPAYTSPFSLNHAATVTFAFVSKAGQTGETAQVSCAPQRTIPVPTLAPGWNSAYFEGNWSNVPDFSKLTPIKSGATDHISLDGRNRDENFAMHFSGYFKAEQEGVYRFTLGSDDGSWLKVGDLTVVDNDGLHSPSPKAGTIWLPKGIHKIEAGYFQGGGAFSLSLNVQVPGTSTPMSVDSYVYRNANK